MNIEPRSNAAEPGEHPDRARHVAERMGRMYDVASTVTGLAAWASPRVASPVSTLLSMLAGPDVSGARFVRIPLETSSGAVLLDQVADLYAARVLSLGTCLRCLCQGGGILVRGSVGEGGRSTMAFGPFDDIAFALAFADGPADDVLNALGAKYELRDVVASEPAEEQG